MTIPLPIQTIYSMAHLIVFTFFFVLRRVLTLNLYEFNYVSFLLFFFIQISIISPIMSPRSGIRSFAGDWRVYEGGYTREGLAREGASAPEPNDLM